YRHFCRIFSPLAPPPLSLPPGPPLACLLRRLEMNQNRLGRILVVDDDDWILSGVQVVLNDAGFQVEFARDGKEGLDAAFRLEPDLIITDVLMPRMDGWSFVRQLRAHS